MVLVKVGSRLFNLPVFLPDSCKGGEITFQCLSDLGMVTTPLEAFKISLGFIASAFVDVFVSHNGGKTSDKPHPSGQEGDRTPSSFVESFRKSLTTEYSDEIKAVKDIILPLYQNNEIYKLAIIDAINKAKLLKHKIVEYYGKLQVLNDIIPKYPKSLFLSYEHYLMYNTLRGFMIDKFVSESEYSKIYYRKYVDNSDVTFLRVKCGRYYSHVLMIDRYVIIDMHKIERRDYKEFIFSWVYGLSDENLLFVNMSRGCVADLLKTTRANLRKIKSQLFNYGAELDEFDKHDLCEETVRVQGDLKIHKVCYPIDTTDFEELFNSPYYYNKLRRILGRVIDQITVINTIHSEEIRRYAMQKLFGSYFLNPIEVIPRDKYEEILDKLSHNFEVRIGAPTYRHSVRGYGVVLHAENHALVYLPRDQYIEISHPEHGKMKLFLEKGLYTFTV